MTANIQHPNCSQECIDQVIRLVLNECFNLIDTYAQKIDPDDLIIDLKEHFGID